MALKEIIAFARSKDPAYPDILHYELMMLDILGYHPNFDTCVFCGAAIDDDEKVCFSRERGGILCGVCSRSLPHRRWSPGLIRGFLAVKRRETGFEAPSLEREAQELMEGFMAYHVDLDLKSYKLLKSMVF